MVQNQRFATAIDDGLEAARAVELAGGGVMLDQTYTVPAIVRR